jgi:uncharacterized protein
MAVISNTAPGVSPGMSKGAVLAAGLMLAAGAGWIGDAQGWRMAALFGLGGSLGLVLYHAAFGFTSAWRRLLVDGDGAGLRAQMIMLALATVVFLPAISGGELFGRAVGGAIAPVGVSVAVGAFIFGIGMQLGGGCASGTLFAVGSGSVRIAVTLAGFIAGSVIATLHMPWWVAQPNFGSISLVRELGMGPAMVLQLAVFGVIAWASWVWQGRRLGARPPWPKLAAPVLARIIRGPWPLVGGAIGLAVLNIATLAISGHPWSITFGFSLWGAKILALGGIDVAAWEFWTWPYPARALAGSVLAEDTSVMNFGIMLGALLAAGLAGKFALDFRVPLRPLCAAIIGGLLLGYGARLAFGCNIGAFFSGVASGSLHGWLWLVCALAGNWVGVRLRPSFGLGN